MFYSRIYWVKIFKKWGNELYLFLAVKLSQLSNV